MARPPNNVNTPAYTILEYPGDVGTYKYTTKISFLKYQRKAGLPATIDTKSIVVLPLPLNLAQSYGINISSESLGVLGNFSADTSGIEGKGIWDAAVSGVNLIGETAVRSVPTLNDVGQYFENAGSTIGKADAASMLLLASKIVGNDNVVRQINANLGRIFNPHLAALFNGVNLRQFQYSWKVSPRSEKEANTLLAIFNHIKKNMHPSIPETAGIKAFLSYPNQVTIDFPNLKNYTKVGRSFITAFNVTNTPSGVAAMYHDGSPVEIGFDLTVMETEIKISEDFDA